MLMKETRYFKLIVQDFQHVIARTLLIGEKERNTPHHVTKEWRRYCSILVRMDEMQIKTKFENLPNEILIDCLEYLRATDLLYSFGLLNPRFTHLIQTLSLHLDLHDVYKSRYDVLCQHMSIGVDAQKQVYSLRLSNKDTPGQINDFLSKFSLDQFSHLHSLTFIDLNDKNIQSLNEILPKSSQIRTLHLRDSQINQDDLQSTLPIDTLLTLSIDSNLTLVEKTIPMKRLTLSTLSLNEICRLFAYTPFLEYLNVSSIRAEAFNAEYHHSSRPPDLKHLILADFRPTFDHLTHFLQNMFNLRNLTIGSSTDSHMLDAPRWERLITSSLPYLNNFRFRLSMNHRLHQRCIYKMFDRFQTNFWLRVHHWYTECSIEKRSLTIYTNPYPDQCGQISLTSKRYFHPLIDNAQTFRSVKKLVLSANDLFEHGDYYFPNITSLIITRSLQFSNENEEERVIECLMKLINFTHLRHLEFPLDCRTQRPSLLFQILRLAPQLSSLRTKSCFFEVLFNQRQSSRYLNEKIRKLDLSDYDLHECDRPLRIQSLCYLMPNLEQLTIPISKPQDWLILLNQFSKLSTLRVHWSSRTLPEVWIQFQIQSSEIDETRQTFCKKHRMALGVWFGKNLIGTSERVNPTLSCPFIGEKTKGEE